MKRTMLRLVCAVLSLGAFLPVLAHAKNSPPMNRISIVKAREVARRIYPGKISGEELEFEGGKWIYSFDLKKPGDNRVHEIHVDAITGKMSGIRIETSADEQKEMKEEKSQSEGE